MRNPFYYGEAAAGEYFTNRKEEIKALYSDLGRGQNVILFSPRRYGKTSLIKKVISILKEKGIFIVYVDLYAATSKKKFIEIFSRAITNAIEADISKIVALIKDLLPRMIPKIIVKPEGLPELEFEFKGTAKNITLILEELYEAVPKYIKKRNKRAVIVFDEFQEILNFEDEEIERTMRSHTQSHHNISYVFMGSKKHMIIKLFDDPNRPFYKSGRIFPLNKIKKEDFLIFIAERFKNAKIKIEEEVILKILEITQCHPYYTQLFCSVLWERCIGMGMIKEEDLSLAQDEAISRSAAIYIEVFDNLTGPQKRLLEALAKENTINIYSREFILENELGAASSVQRSLKALVKKGIIEKENGSYIFSDIFFEKWIVTKQ